ncbi:MAG TPA: ATP-binding protein [Candidatus Udaeobacter sp.]|nr:ATP-binding protein [Candidatus Udaeobacter sp.]
MSLLIAVLICGALAMIAVIVWRKWIAPWRQVENVITQIGRGERPRTFLMEGGAPAQRIGFQLEKIVGDLEQRQKQIAKRESGMQTIFSAMQDALLVVDSNRRVILTNQTFRKLFDSPEISVATPLLEIVRDPTLDRLLTDAFRGDGPVRCELTLDGSQIELHAIATKNEASEITGALVLFHDITELKKIDQVRRDFVANVSHELRTPLSILRGYIETLLDSPKTPREELTRILRVMERHSDRLELLVEDLLTLAQLESGNPNLQMGTVELPSFLPEIVRDWERKLAMKQLAIVVDLPTELPPISADRTRLQEALYNLLDNAVKYSREHGEIRLSARRRDGEMVLAVSDDGIGIATEDLPRIFERFYRADKARSPDNVRGTGLGLAIVKHIAQLHGGRVEAESELERGTTIRVILPSATSRDS